MNELNIGSKVLVEGQGWQGRGRVVEISDWVEEMVGEKVVRFRALEGQRGVKVRFSNLEDEEWVEEWQVRVLES